MSRAQEVPTGESNTELLVLHSLFVKGYNRVSNMLSKMSWLHKFNPVPPSRR